MISLQLSVFYKYIYCYITVKSFEYKIVETMIVCEMLLLFINKHTTMCKETTIISYNYLLETT